ncbi:hypothetical protein KKB68_01435 [Patescibacteria group bacterium]|nr:hypothetical protein [Patescibacteria group bacterium]
MKRYLIPTFLALVGVFVAIIGIVLLPPVRDLLQGNLVIGIFGIFSLLGVALTFLAVRAKVEARLRKFLILTGASAIGFFISVLLHNLIYGLFIYLFGVDFWDKVGLGDEPFFFLIAVIVCPIGFLVGVVGSIVLLIRDKKNKKELPQT